MALDLLFLLVLNVLNCHAFPTGDNSDLSMQEQVAALTKRLQDLEHFVSDNVKNTTTPISAFRQVDPVIVGFTARLNKKLYNLPLDSTIIFDKVFYNAGNGYDETTGVFTCPISGVYLFAIFLEAFNSRTAAVEIIIDGNDDKISAVSEPAVDGEDDTGGNILVVHVVKGQRIWVRTYDTDSQSIYPYFTSFSGVLIQST